MDEDVEFTKITDEHDYLRGGTTVRHRVYVFYIGPYGPFTEKVPLDGFDENEIHQRVLKLRTHLANRPR